MRWQVEMTSIGKTDTKSVVVEADSWQKALQAARQLRGENGPMSGFSIELLDQGYRAVDPMSRLVFVVRRAADDAPLTGTDGRSAGPATKSPGGTDSKIPRPASTPPPPSVAAGGKKAHQQTIAFGSGDVAKAMAAATPAPVASPAAPSTDRDVNAAAAAAAAAAAEFTTHAATPAPSPSEVAATQVIFKREQDPTSAQPLTYREYVYAVASGTKEAEAERVLLAQFELVKRAIDSARPGKLVNLAVFDVVFKGKPPVPPLATLSWKDWKGAPPVIEFPRRGPSKAAPSTPPPGMAPPSTAPVAAKPAPKPAPSFSPAPAFPAASSPLAPAPTPGPGPTERPSTTGRISRPPAQRGRVKGDELITALFEAMHDLHFLHDAIEGGDFCLALAIETIPSAAGLVHLYDIDRREFVVACTAGKGAEGLLTRRHAENDPLLLKAMRHRRAVVIPDASHEEGTDAERYATVGGAKSLIVAPVLYGGRFLGAIEIVNPVDGAPFTDDEGNAISYIAEQYAEFISQHGVIVDAGVIAQRPSQLRAR